MEDYKRYRRDQCDLGRRWMTLDLERENVSAKYFYEDSMFFPEVYQKRAIGVQTCEVETSEDGSEGWLIHRIGPMVGTGGYDRHDVHVTPLPHPKKAKFITGKVAAPVYEDGEIAGYPPLHTHHIMVGFDGVYHALESHGDAICSQDFGAESCYLISYPEGMGLPLANETYARDSMRLTFVINDVRRNDETNTPNPLLFYTEVALKWSARDPEVSPISAAALHMQGNEHSYAANVVTRRPSLRWNTGKWPADGRMIISPEDQLPWFHAHRSYFDSMWAFAASPEELGLRPEELLTRVDDNNQTKNGPLGEFDYVWSQKNWTKGDAIRALEDKVGGSDKGFQSLRCWLRTSDEERVLEFVDGTAKEPREAKDQDWKASWYDRSGEVHCDPWSFKAGDNYTVVALNGIDQEKYNWTHDQSDFFTMMQHGIFFTAYETTGPELGPTVEMFGDFDSSLASDVKVKMSYVPDSLKGDAERYFREENAEEFRRAINEDFDGKIGGHVNIIRQATP